MSDPRYEHEFLPNRQDLCKQIVGNSMCHEKEDFVSHQRWKERHLGAEEEVKKMEDKRIKVLEAIAEDMKNDAKEFDGRPFDGKTVAEYFGNHGAAITALADVVKSILEQGE